MADRDPLWCRAAAVSDTLEVARQLAILSASDTVANDIASMGHIAALIQCARDSLNTLAVELEGLEEDSRHAQ